MDFDKGLIWIANKSYLLHHRSDRYSWYRRVVLQEDVVTPARSEAVVPTKMQFRKIPNEFENKNWSTELTHIKDGLHVTRTLIPKNSWVNIPVRVMNVKEKPITLKSNEVMSYLQEVEVIDGDVLNSSVNAQVDEEKESIPDYSLKSCVCKGHQSEGGHVVKSVTAVNEFSATTKNDNIIDIANTEFWSDEGIRMAQDNDPDVSYIRNLVKNSTEKPPWNLVACQSKDVRVLWGMWPRLRVWNGILQRRFESVDGLTITWQVVLPRKMRKEFLSVVHGRTTGGHLVRKRTAALIQSRAYWPTWSSDLDAFLKECQSCARYHWGSEPKRTHLRKSIKSRPLVDHVEKLKKYFGATPATWVSSELQQCQKSF